MRGARALSSILLTSFGLLLSPIASAAAPDGPRMQAGFVERVLANTFDSPISIAVAPDGRVFVCEQRGTLRVIKNDSLLEKPFVTIPVSTTDEDGLLAVTFDPAFATNGYVYVVFSVPATPVHNRIVRLTASGDTALAGSMVDLFDLDNHVVHWHLGGALHMGPDGKLWHSQGDNGHAINAQDMTTTFGKILRINTDGSIPTDNPFYGSTTGNNRAIWAKGLRNPFTFAFQPGTGRLYINDVGEWQWEEIDEGAAGANYAWPGWEGPGNTMAGMTNPVHAYPHTEGCAITGGTFYNPAAPTFPASYVGKYFYADYCANEIRMIDPASPAGYTVFGPTIAAGPVDLRVGPDGNLYYLSRGNSDPAGGVGSSTGMVVRVSYTSGNSPSIAQHPADRTVTAGRTAEFSVVANGAPTLTYRWQKDGGDIMDASGPSYTTPATVRADSGSLFRCIVTNGYGSVASNAAVLKVTSNQPPVPVISTPVQEQHYNAGTTLSFSGGASDPEDGPLPASELTWWIDFHHDQHIHPGMAATSGIDHGTYEISSGGEVSPRVWFRVNLEARDSFGLTATTYVDVLPNLSQITLATSPPGLRLELDGQPVTTPHSVIGVVGHVRTLGAVGPQTQDGLAWSFRSWSDERAATHDIITPANNTTYTASFAPDTAAALPPGAVSLAPCAPNPSLDQTTVSFRLGSPEIAKLEFFDVAGHRVARLLDGPQTAGVHHVDFDTRSLPAGLYFVRLWTPSHAEWQKFTRFH